MCSLKKTVVLKIDPTSPDKEVIRRAAGTIRQGGLVAFPTETVYGIAVNLLDRKAVNKLYKVKNRPKSKPFTVHIAKIRTVRDMGCRITKEAKRLIDRFWPGPLTIILKSRSGKRIGFRMPANKAALSLIRQAEVPVAAPSANMSDGIPAKNARQVLRDLDGKIDMLLDGGQTKVGVESTIVDLTTESCKILREGAIKRDAIKKAAWIR